MVTVSTRPEPGSKMVLEIEVPPDEVDRHFATAYRQSPSAPRVPGFRPGKAPRQVIDRFVGRGSVLAEAIDHLVQDSYDKALDQTDLIPIDQPAVDIDAASLAEGQGDHVHRHRPGPPGGEPRFLHRLFVRPRGA